MRCRRRRHGGVAVDKTEEDEDGEGFCEGMFCEHCNDWVVYHHVRKIETDETEYHLTFSVGGVSDREKKEILSPAKSFCSYSVQFSEEDVEKWLEL